MKTERSRLRRLHQRGHYDHESIYQVLDAGRQCSVGYVFKGAPYVTPTIHWREGEPGLLARLPPPVRCCGRPTAPMCA